MIKVRNLSFSYKKHEVLDDINFDISSGEITGILGNNGSGKSTLIKCLNHINKPKKGKIFIDNREINSLSRLEIAKNIAYVPQTSELNYLTVFDTVILGRKPYIKWGVTDSDIQICEDAIKAIGFEDYKLRFIHDLSGGEVQKVMIARALVQQPKILLLDEPTSNLDPKNQHDMLKIVENMSSEKNISVVMVIHDINLALKYCQKFLFLKDGRIHSFVDKSMITQKTLNEVYDIKSKIFNIDEKKFVLIE